jgi:hypothetical protein
MADHAHGDRAREAGDAAGEDATKAPGGVPQADRQRRLRRAALASALLLATIGTGQSRPALADPAGGDGGEHNNDFNADHSGIYQVLRGDLVCDRREACGGAAAIPMNRPGFWYLPGGMLSRRPALGPSRSAYWIAARLRSARTARKRDLRLPALMPN